jgi:thioredoxin 1
VDVDENPNLAMEYKVVSIPMLLLFKNGEVVKKQIGALPKDEIKKFIEE